MMLKREVLDTLSISSNARNVGEHRFRTGLASILVSAHE